MTSIMDLRKNTYPPRNRYFYGKNVYRDEFFVIDRDTRMILCEKATRDLAEAAVNALNKNYNEAMGRWPANAKH